MLAYRLPNQLTSVLIRLTFGLKWKDFTAFSASNLLLAADPPTITQHPEELNGVAPGKLVTFTVQATGTEPLTYQWQWKPAGEGSKEWQKCNLKRFPGANSSMLTIPSVQQSNEGSYCCTINNPVGSQTSKPAVLSVGKILPQLQHAQYTLNYSWLSGNYARWLLFKIFVHSQSTSMNSCMK